MINREITNYEKGLLCGIAVGSIVGPSITLVVFCLIICYDLGRPQIIDIGQRTISKLIGIKEDKKKEKGKKNNQLTKSIKNIDPNILEKILKFSAQFVSNEKEDEKEDEDEDEEEEDEKEEDEDKNEKD